MEYNGIANIIVDCNRRLERNNCDNIVFNIRRTAALTFLYMHAVEDARQNKTASPAWHEVYKNPENFLHYGNTEIKRILREE